MPGLDKSATVHAVAAVARPASHLRRDQQLAYPEEGAVYGLLWVAIGNLENLRSDNKQMSGRRAQHWVPAALFEKTYHGRPSTDS